MCFSSSCFESSHAAACVCMRARVCVIFAMDSDSDSSDFEEVYFPKVYRRRRKSIIIDRVKNLDDYGNHIVQDYYLAFTVAMCNFNVKFLKSGDLNNLARECELVLPLVRVRTSRLHRLPVEKKIQLLAKFIEIDASNRSKEYVKRLLDELHEHVELLWDDEKDVAIYKFMEMLRIKTYIRMLTTTMNRITAFHQITKL